MSVNGLKARKMNF